MKDIFLFLFYRNMIAEIWGKEVETKRWQQDYPKFIIIQQIQSSNKMYQQRIELYCEIEEGWKHLGKQGDRAATK